VLERLIDRMRPQVAQLILNANDDAARFASYGLKVIADTLPGRQGPLAGVLAALDWAVTEAPDIGWLVTIPGDAPFLPADLVARLQAARRQSGACLACAVSNGRTHPVIGLWPVDLRDDLRRAVVEQGIRKIDAFTGRYDVARAEWPAEPLDPFFNVNTPEDLAEAERLAALAW
jgi:molybdopterin-guanine dinucleotide biosynthesis protein A